MRTWTRPGVYLVVYLDVTWCLPGLEPGRRKTFNFEGTKTFNLWNGGLTSDSEGSKSQKTIQFPADQVNPGKKPFNFPGVVQAFPGVSRCFQVKKEAEASRFIEFQADYQPAPWFVYRLGRSLHTPGSLQNTLSRTVARSSPSNQYWELFVWSLAPLRIG